MGDFLVRARKRTIGFCFYEIRCASVQFIHRKQLIWHLTVERPFHCLWNERYSDRGTLVPGCVERAGNGVIIPNFLQMSQNQRFITTLM